MFRLTNPVLYGGAFMRRTALVAMIHVFFLGGILGCGSSSPPPPEERPGVKQRQDMQKEKGPQRYMKPDEK